MEDDIHVLVIAYREDQAAARQISIDHGHSLFGPEVVKICAGLTPQAASDHTDVGVFGGMSTALAEAYRLSMHPKFQVIENPDRRPIDALLAECTPAASVCFDDEPI